MTGQISAQELKNNADYQRALNYGLIIHIELSGMYAIKPTGEMLEKRNEIMPQIERLISCAKESYDSAKPKITDKKFRNDIDTAFLAEQKAIHDLKDMTVKTNAHDLMGNQLMDYMFGDRISDAFKKELDWNLANISESKAKIDLRDDANYQRLLTCFLIMHDEIKMLKRANTTDAIQMRNQDLPLYGKILKCAKESFQLAKPNITDPKKLAHYQTQIESFEKLIGMIKTYNFKDAPTWQMIDTLLYIQVSEELEKSPFCTK